MIIFVEIFFVMEELMQYVWQYRLWPPRNMVTTDGRRVEIIDPGLLNRDAGPDFFNAKVCIGGQLWIGNVEIHVRASDWMRHGHHNDRAYDTVVLHVVDKDDAAVLRPDGTQIPQLVMQCAPDFSKKYADLVHNPVRELPCGNEIGSLPRVYVTEWLTALAHERLFAKCQRIADLVSRFSGSWTDAIYCTLARALGFNTNSEPFELLAVTTPLRCMMRHADSLMTIEAILFGQASLIPAPTEGEDPYVTRLRGEYQFMAAKYGLQPSRNILWKTARMRPQNLPHRRIAFLAALIHNGFRLAGKLLAVRSEEEARALFDVALSGFWVNHYTFAPAQGAAPKALGYASVTVLLINVVVPLMYAYATATGALEQQERAIDLMHTLKAESNGIVDIYARAGIAATCAFDSQALIQLRKEYCQSRKCLFCRVGHKLLSERVVR